MVQKLEDVDDFGYDPDFLGVEIPTPAPNEKILGDLLVWDGGTILPYTHFSLAMSSTRRFAYWVAWNIDGGALKRLSRANLSFSTDPRIPSSAQIGNELYVRNPLDRGHLARRADLTWGDLMEAQQANRDSFYFTNIAPQMDDFNQSSRQGLWGRLEDALYEDVEVDDLKVSVMAGPVFQDSDQIFRGVALPREYWKVLAYCHDGELSVRSFVLTQSLDQLESVIALDEFRVYQVTVSDLEKRTGLVFSHRMRSADVAEGEIPGAQPRRALARMRDIRW